jgi:hypothetical protein
MNLLLEIAFTKDNFCDSTNIIDEIVTTTEYAFISPLAS